jgi:2-polyprenyl-3-methyl-5-hydroxy-6-metoxy-1,4-benzoquinol methylase
MGLREKVTTATVASTLGYYQLLAGRRWIWAGRIAGAIPLLRDYATVPFMFLKASTGASLLDIGCGSGQFLAMMRDLGWEVEGVEPDPKSARIAQETRRLRVQAGAVEQADLPSQSKDVITMTHVIEHLPDPLAVLRRCYQILRPEGLLVVATPNVDSLLHRRFRRCWRGLEPPRHMLLFNPATLGRFAKEAGFEISTIRTVTRASREIYIQSSGIESESPYVFPNIPKRVKVGSWVFWFIEEMLRMASLNVGEEVVLRAMKPGEVDPKGLETRPGSGS